MLVIYLLQKHITEGKKSVSTEPLLCLPQKAKQSKRNIEADIEAYDE